MPSNCSFVLHSHVSFAALFRYFRLAGEWAIDFGKAVFDQHWCGGIVEMTPVISGSRGYHAKVTMG